MSSDGLHVRSHKRVTRKFIAPVKGPRSFPIEVTACPETRYRYLGHEVFSQGSRSDGNSNRCLFQPVKDGAKKVGATRFERATFWSQTRRSTRLSYAPIGDFGDRLQDSGLWRKVHFRKAWLEAARCRTRIPISLRGLVRHCQAVRALAGRR